MRRLSWWRGLGGCRLGKGWSLREEVPIGPTDESRHPSWPKGSFSPWEESVESLRCFLLHPWQDVGVRLQSDPDRRVAQALGLDLRMHAFPQHRRRGIHPHTIQEGEDLRQRGTRSRSVGEAAHRPRVRAASSNQPVLLVSERGWRGTVGAAPLDQLTDELRRVGRQLIERIHVGVARVSHLTGVVLMVVDVGNLLPGGWAVQWLIGSRAGLSHPAGAVARRNGRVAECDREGLR